VVIRLLHTGCPYSCLLCTDRFCRCARYRGVHQQVVGFGSAQTGDSGTPSIHSVAILNAAVIYLQSDSRRRLPPQGNSDLAAHGGSVLVLGMIIWTAVALRKRFAQSREFSKARILLHAISERSSAGSWRLLVAAHYRGCSAADAGHGNADRDSYGRWRDSLRVFGAGRADVLQVDSARKGSCRRGAPAGNHGMSTARTTELTLSARREWGVGRPPPEWLRARR